MYTLSDASSTEPLEAKCAKIGRSCPHLQLAVQGIWYKANLSRRGHIHNMAAGGAHGKPIRSIVLELTGQPAGVLNRQRQQESEVKP